MYGGAGNDIYYVNNTVDRVYETTSATGTSNAGGTDKINSPISFDLSAYAGVAFVENLTLTGRFRHQGYRQHAREHFDWQ